MLQSRGTTQALSATSGPPAGFRRAGREISVKETGLKVVATNRSAGRDYFLGDHLEAGIALQGSEIKSVRAGQVSLKESFIRVEAGQAWLLDAHIAPYQPAARENHDPRRPRRLPLLFPGRPAEGKTPASFANGSPAASAQS